MYYADQKERTSKSIPRNIGLDIIYHDDDIVYIKNIEHLDYHPNMKIGELTIVCCVEGKIQVAVDDKIREMSPNSILIIYPNSVVNFVMQNIYAEFKILCISQQYVEKFIDWMDLVRIGLLLKTNPVLSVDELKLKNFLELIDVFSATCDPNHPYFNKIVSKVVEATLYAVLGFIKLTFKTELNSTLPDITSGERVFKKFISLLTKQDNTSRSVSFYADELCITPKYLARVCTDLTGQPASYWIREYTIKRIKYYLRFTDKTIKDIYILMDFPNMSFFSHYFKKWTGITPAEYRRDCKIPEINVDK